MDSWTYLFSKFSSEALLFEGIIITGLLAAYAAYWVLKKRKMGAAHEVIPSGLVKTYLNDLIQQAHFVRQQLFGLLAEAGVSSQELKNLTKPGGGPQVDLTALMGAAKTISENPELGQKLSALEQRLQQQNQAMEGLLAEKSRLEKALAEAGSSSSPSSGATGSDAGELNKLKDRIKELEERLAEYSVIEDDLANLKRLQQENAKLKEALGAKGGGNIDSSSSAPEITSEPAPSTKTDANVNEDDFEALAKATEATIQAETKPEVAAAEPQKQESAPKAAPAEAPTAAKPAAVATAAAVSAAPAPAPAPAPASTTPASPAPATPATPADALGGQKTDEDLLSEFEKMLNM